MVCSTLTGISFSVVSRYASGGYLVDFILLVFLFFFQLLPLVMFSPPKQNESDIIDGTVKQAVEMRGSPDAMKVLSSVGALCSSPAAKINVPVSVEHRAVMREVVGSNLRIKCCLCNFICKWLDFKVFMDKDYNP